MRAFIIKVLPLEGDDACTLVHCLRNFAEQVARNFTGGNVACVADMDGATTLVRVHVPRARDLGTVRAYLERALADNGLLGRSDVSREI